MCVNATSSTRSRELAEEVVHDVFLELWRRPGGDESQLELALILHVSHEPRFHRRVLPK